MAARYSGSPSLSLGDRQQQSLRSSYYTCTGPPTRGPLKLRDCEKHIYKITKMVRAL